MIHHFSWKWKIHQNDQCTYEVPSTREVLANFIYLEINIIYEYVAYSVGVCGFIHSNPNKSISNNCLYFWNSFFINSTYINFSSGILWPVYFSIKSLNAEFFNLKTGMSECIRAWHKSSLKTNLLLVDAD